MTIYRKRKGRDTWHFHEWCRWWPMPYGRIDPPYIERDGKPRSGEFCNECRAKVKRDKGA